MSTSTARQTFREVVAEVAEKARAKLPTQVNGRIESAIKLVLLHDVMPQADGSILVGSSSDPLQSYLLTGQSCECQDFTRGQAPDGWCQHRIAAGIHKRVGQLVPAPDGIGSTDRTPAPDALNPVESTPQPGGVRTGDTTPAPLPEAPVSITLKATLDGHEVMVTLRGHDFASVQAQVEQASAWLKAHAPAPPPQGQGQEWCSTHGVALKVNHGKDGRTWLSHRTPEGQWCKGK